MRFKILARSITQPYNYILRLSDGRIVKDTMAWTRIHLKVGDTGKIIMGENGRQRIEMDAIVVDDLTE